MPQPLSFIAALLLAVCVSAADNPRPNIVVVLADDMGWGDSAPYGNKIIQTPNLSRLAAEGVRFTQSYAAAGVCSPSRSAILTGRTPYRNGVWQHLSGNTETHLRTSEITYPKLLKGIGYETCHVGKWHLNSVPQFNVPEYPQPGDHGYDYWMATQNNAVPSHQNPDNFVRNGTPVGELTGYSSHLVAAEAVHWLKNIHDPAKPFALSIWFHEPHKPIATDPKYSDLYGNDPNRIYQGNVTQMDAGLGRVMQALDELGLTENTWIIFMSDNGPEGQSETNGGSTGGLRGRKRSDHEGGIRVPGIARWPGRIKPGTVSDVPVVGTDIFATVLDITGLPLPTRRTIDGVSMLPAFAGQPVTRKVPLFWRTHVSQADDRVALRIGDWKLVGNDTLTKWQLYQIQPDWKEQNDLAAKMPEKTEEMKKIILQVWRDIEAEGPSEWWHSETRPPFKGATYSY